MPVEFHCQQCQTVLRVPDAAAGKPVRCPKCSAVVVAPQPGSEQTPAVSPPGSPLAAGTPATPRGPNVNPYASPLHSPAANAGIPELVGGPLDVGYVLSRTWEIFKIHWGMCLVASLIPGAVQQVLVIVLQVIIGVAGQVDPALAVGVMILAVLAIIPVIVWLNAGQTLFFIRVARGETPDIVNVFRGAPWILRFIGLFLLLWLIVDGVLLICVGAPALLGGALGAIFRAAGPGAALGLIVGGLLGVCAVIYLTLAYSQAIYLMIDRNAGVIDSLRGSWQITQGNKLTIFLILLLLGLINLGGVLACCIGIIATMPYTALAVAVMYTVMAKGNQQWAM